MPRTYGTTNLAPYAAAPAVGNAGDAYYNTGAKRLYLSDGSVWNPQAGLPAGGSASQVLSKIDGTDYNTQWTPTASAPTTSALIIRDSAGRAQVQDPAAAQDITSKQYVDGHDMPSAGSTGQALIKASASNYATQWATIQAARSTGATILGATTVAAGTSNVINLAASLGNVPITLPTGPPLGTVISFIRIDNNQFTSTPQITAGGGDTIGDSSPYVLSMRSALLTLTYLNATWYPALTFSGGSGMLGATANPSFNPSLMSRDVNGRSQVQDPSAAQDIASKNYVDVRAIDPGGTAGQFFGKNTATDYDASWLSGLPQSAIPTTNLNTALAPGFYWMPTTGTNGPVASRAYHVWTYAASDTATNVVQVAMRATAGVTAASNEMWQRTGSGGNWSPWVNIVGGGSYFESYNGGTNASSTTWNAFTPVGATRSQIGTIVAAQFNISTGIWTCPADGIYSIVSTLQSPSVTPTAGGRYIYQINTGTTAGTGTILSRSEIDMPTSSGASYAFGVVNYEGFFTAGDQITVCIYTSGIYASKSYTLNTLSFRLISPIAAPVISLTPTYHLVGQAGEVPYTNGWVDYASTYYGAHYWLDPSGYVHIGGTVKSGTVSTSYTAGAIFTIPAGLRPTINRFFPAICSGGVAAGVLVTTAGYVVAMFGNNTQLGMEGIIYPPEL